MKGEFKTQDSPGCSNLSFKMQKTDGKNYQDSNMTRNIQKSTKMDSAFLRPMTLSNHSALLHSLMVPINVAAELN